MWALETLKQKYKNNQIVVLGIHRKSLFLQRSSPEVLHNV